MKLLRNRTTRPGDKISPCWNHGMKGLAVVSDTVYIVKRIRFDGFAICTGPLDGPDWHFKSWILR